MSLKIGLYEIDRVQSYAAYECGRSYSLIDCEDYSGNTIQNSYESEFFIEIPDNATLYISESEIPYFKIGDEIGLNPYSYRDFYEAGFRKKKGTPDIWISEEMWGEIVAELRSSDNYELKTDQIKALCEL